MKRYLKIGDTWLTVGNLKELLELLEIQETTDKEEPGSYLMFGECGSYDLYVDNDYNLIIVEVTSYEK